VSHKKTCDYIFYNNFNNKCPIAITFGMCRQSRRHRKMVSFPTLTYLVQLPYLGKSQNTKNDKFRHKKRIVLWINNVLRHAWLLEASAETARHRSNWPFTFTLGSKNISSVIPIVDTATDTITDLLNVKRVRSSWDRCVAWCRLAHKPDHSASWMVIRW